MTTSGLATAGGGTGTVTNTYGYDQADRLTSWTATPSGGTATTKTYGYDDNGNLTSDNGITYSYDARNELTSDGTAAPTPTPPTATWPASTGSSRHHHLHLRRLRPADHRRGLLVVHLGRPRPPGQRRQPAAAARSIALTYDGMTNEVASDSSATYSRDPAGQITGVNTDGGRQTARAERPARRPVRHVHRGRHAR